MRYAIISLTALGIIALGGFLIKVYGQARYDAGVSDCKAEQAKANNNEKDKRINTRQKVRKKYANVDNVYCELLSHGELRESDCK